MSFVKGWTKEIDQYLRDHYKPGFRVSPAILAMNVHKALRDVINRMAELGIRKRMGGERY